MDPKDFKLTTLKNKIMQTRQKLNQAWAVNQITNSQVLRLGVKFDKLCNEYERLKKQSQTRDEYLPKDTEG